MFLSVAEENVLNSAATAFMHLEEDNVGQRLAGLGGFHLDGVAAGQWLLQHPWVFSWSAGCVAISIVLMANLSLFNC